MSLGEPIPVYPTVTSKIWRRLRDIPWRMADLRDRLIPGAFAELCVSVQPYTMCSTARLRGLHQAVERVVSRGIAGDVVECGAARGGSAALIGLALKQLGANRALWVFDTFEGLVPPTDADPPHETPETFTGSCRGDLEEVDDLFKRLGIQDSTHLVKGPFETTLRLKPVGDVALLHIDADWYESVKTCLDHLYNQMTPGGIIQIDDYGHWTGARRAVDEFREQHRITTPLRYIDYTGRQFAKPL